MPANGWVCGGGTGWVCGFVARFGAAEEAMLPPANGWLQHADAAASGGGGGADELDPDVSAAGGAGAAEPANGWGQAVAACGGAADELEPDVSTGINLSVLS